MSKRTRKPSQASFEVTGTIPEQPYTRKEDDGLPDVSTYQRIQSAIQSDGYENVYSALDDVAAAYSSGAISRQQRTDLYRQAIFHNV